MTYREASVAVVVPAYNEEEFVGDVIDGVPSFVDRIYAVDDRSTDDTYDVIEQATARVNKNREPTAPFDSVVVPFRHEENQGVGAAILTGYRQAQKDEVDIVATMDGDDQMDPAFLPDLLDPIVDGDAEYTKGDRLAAPEYVSDMSRWRLLGNVLLTVLMRFSSGYWRLRDPQNGYTAISREALLALDFDSLYEQYGFRNDVLVRLNVAGYRVFDVPHPARYEDETSGIRYRSFVPRLSWLLLQRFGWRLSQHGSRDRDYLTPTAFLCGTVAAVGSLLRLVTSRTSHSHERPQSLIEEPAEHRRTDGGKTTEQSDDSSDSSHTKTLILVSLVLLSVGTLLDIKRRAGQVVRSSDSDERANDSPEGAER